MRLSKNKRRDLPALRPLMQQQPRALFPQLVTHLRTRFNASSTRWCESDVASHSASLSSDSCGVGASSASDLVTAPLLPFSFDSISLQDANVHDVDSCQRTSMSNKHAATDAHKYSNNYEHDGHDNTSRPRTVRLSCLHSQWTLIIPHVSSNALYPFLHFMIHFQVIIIVLDNSIICDTINN